jgi:hypothetical protein
MTKNDMSCHVDMCWTLAFMSDGDSDEVQAVIDLALFPILLELLGRHDTISLPILRIFSNMASGSDDQTQVSFRVCRNRVPPHPITSFTRLLAMNSHH